MFPNAQRINRGHYDIKKLIQACKANGVSVKISLVSLMVKVAYIHDRAPISIFFFFIFQVTDFILLQETRGCPDGMIVCHLPFGPTAYFTLSNVVMRHEVPDCGTISEEYPHLIFDNLTSRLGLRVYSSC